MFFFVVSIRRAGACMWAQKRMCFIIVAWLQLHIYMIVIHAHLGMHFVTEMFEIFIFVWLMFLWWFLQHQYCAWWFHWPVWIFSLLICGHVFAFATCNIHLCIHACAPCRRWICVWFDARLLPQMVLRRVCNSSHVAVRWKCPCEMQCLPQSNR